MDQRIIVIATVGANIKVPVPIKMTVLEIKEMTQDIFREGVWMDLTYYPPSYLISAKLELA